LSKLAGLGDNEAEIDVADHRPAVMISKVSQMDPLTRIIQLTK
jgi:hypothetical protein